VCYISLSPKPPAKIRTGPPVDDEEDYALNVWAGVLPLSLVSSEPIDDDRLNPALTVSSTIRDYRRKPKDANL